MKTCENCGKEFPSLFKDDNGKRVDARKRKYCLECNPVGERKFWGGKLTNKSLGIKRDRKVKRICKTCKREFENVSRNLECTTCKNKANRKKRKEKAYKILGGKCKICGYKKCTNAMDIHHLNGDDKKLTFAGSWGLAWKTIEKELDKCVLLCCRCHREVHDKLIDL